MVMSRKRARRRPSPAGRAVASFPANEWNLHDMHANVSEWVEDCWHDSYEEAPEDGQSWLDESVGDVRPEATSWPLSTLGPGEGGGSPSCARPRFDNVYTLKHVEMLVVNGGRIGRAEPPPALFGIHGLRASAINMRRLPPD